MDGSRFDYLARRWATRRTAIGGLVASISGLTGLADLNAEAKQKRKRKRKRKDAGDHADARETKRHDGVIAEKKKKKKCKGGMTKCGKKLCVNASTDARHCGGCGHACGNGQACVGGVCTSTGPVTCPVGQLRCGSGCVDPKSDEAHCGGCGNACQGDLTCLDGTCGCADAGDTKCGNLCVDIQNDDAHCGGCANAPCGAGQRCQGGQCVAVGGYPCDDVYDCGGRDSGVVCGGNGQCVCADPTKGLCGTPQPGSVNCNVCCPGGNRNCPGDKECNGPSSPTAYCTCPSGTELCPSSPAQHCSESFADDPRRCGTTCTECTLQNTGARCCFGTCIIGGSPGGSDTSTERQICGSDCTSCPSGTICCNNGPATAPECVAPSAGTSVCPGAGG